MRILIVGYGSMGKEVEKALLSRGHSVAGRIDISGDGDDKELKNGWLDRCDGVIEFSLADAVLGNAALYTEKRVPAVIGTTGWFDHLPEVRKLVDTHKAPLLYGTNFALGAHIFFRLAETATVLVDKLPEYDMMLHEYHHKNKKDSPSGTALTAAQRILSANSHKDTIVTETLDRKIRDNELHVTSTRGGSIPGIHTFTLDCDADTITVEHTARNRSGLATGAVKALEWLNGKQGLFTVDQFISSLLGGIT